MNNIKNKIKNIDLIQFSKGISYSLIYPIDYNKTFLQLTKLGVYCIKSIKNNKFQIYMRLNHILLCNLIYNTDDIKNKNKIKNIYLIHNVTVIPDSFTYRIDYIKTFLKINKSSTFSTYFTKFIKNNKVQIYTKLRLLLIHKSIYNINHIIFL